MKTYFCEGCGRDLESAECIPGPGESRSAWGRLRCPECGGKVRFAGASLTIIGCIVWGAIAMCGAGEVLLPALAALVVVGIFRTGRQGWALHRRSSSEAYVILVVLLAEAALLALIIRTFALATERPW